MIKILTRAILLMIKELNLNKIVKWTTYDKYIKFQAKIIKDNKLNLNDKDINDFIKYLIDLEEDDEEEKSIALDNNNYYENLENEDDIQEKEDEKNYVNRINSESDINDNSLSIKIAISEDDISIYLLLNKLDLNNDNVKNIKIISLHNKENNIQNL